jgi:hypothetical protein
VRKILASFAQIVVDRAYGDKLNTDKNTVGERRIAVEVRKKYPDVKGMEVQR